MITINLDLGNKTLSFCINDKDQGLAYDNIECEEGLEYRLTVTFIGNKVGMKLISYEEKSVWVNFEWTLQY